MTLMTIYSDKMICQRILYFNDGPQRKCSLYFAKADELSTIYIGQASYEAHYDSTITKYLTNAAWGKASNATLCHSTRMSSPQGDPRRNYLKFTFFCQCLSAGENNKSSNGQRQITNFSGALPVYHHFASQVSVSDD